jgi:hypothetical protein
MASLSARSACDEILLDMRRRERQHRADALEAVPRGILRQAGGIEDVDGDAEQVADGIAVLLARQPAVGHRGVVVALPRAVGLGQLAGDPVRHPGDVGRRRTRLLLRRHVAGIDALHHLHPVPRRRRAGEVGRDGVEAQVALLLLRPMARGAVLGDERLDHLREGDALRCGDRRRPHHQRQARQGGTDEGAGCGGHGSGAQSTKHRWASIPRVGDLANRLLSRLHEGVGIRMTTSRGTNCGSSRMRFAGHRKSAHGVIGESLCLGAPASAGRGTTEHVR